MGALSSRDFGRMRRELDTFDRLREEVIGKSRSILKDSKLAAYNIHRADLAAAKVLLAKAKNSMAQLKRKTHSMSEAESIGAFSAAVQEYVEAYCFFTFISKGSIAEKEETGAKTEDYLLGICDLTGELARYAVRSATRQDRVMVEKIRDAVDDINGQLMQFNFRNGELRKKYDTVKWNLKKIEDVYYDLSARR